MAEDRYQLQQSGQAVIQPDFNLLGKTGALADDRTLASLLRQLPFDGTNVIKWIQPHGNLGTAKDTVESSGSSGGTVVVRPFRAFVGPRTAIAANAEMDNWRDIRSCEWAGIPGSGSSSALIGIANGDPSHARIDLVYAQFSLDQNANQVTRKVKSPTGTTVTPTLIYQTISQSISILVQPGTASATPALPTTPADAGGNYNIPLAYVRVPAAFNASASTFNGSDILPAASVVSLSRTTGAVTMRPARSNANIGGAIFTPTRIAAWANGSLNAARTDFFVPHSMIGSEQLFVALDLLDTSNSANWSIANGGIVDDSRDWRNRSFWWMAMFRAGVGTIFAWNKSASGGSTVVPQGSLGPMSGSRAAFGMGQSFVTDFNGVVAGSSIVGYFDHTVASEILTGSSAKFALYVDSATGNMKLYANDFPGVKALIWLFPSSPFPAY